MSMQLTLHQTDLTIADFSGCLAHLQQLFSPQKPASGLHIFPELFLTGYPLQDLCLQHAFIRAYQTLLQQIEQWALSLESSNWLALLGGLAYELDQNNLPLKIENVIYRLEAGRPLERVYTKMLLPNYDIFDEKKYFSPGRAATLLEWQGYHLGLLICEDMWVSSCHDCDPTAQLYELAWNKLQGRPLDLIVNLSASPFHFNKHELRVARARELATWFQAPFVYVNRVGGEDEILFDGRSFVVTPTQTLFEAPAFCAASSTVVWPCCPSLAPIERRTSPSERTQNTWENLFTPQLVQQPTEMLPRLATYTDNELAEIIEALQFGLHEYARKNGFKKFIIALSGGMDSALVVALTHLMIQRRQAQDRFSVEAIYMPSQFSATLSYDLSRALCAGIGIKLHYLPIKFLHSTLQKSLQSSFAEEMKDLTNQNLQSRLRGLLLYAFSNQTDAMVINTSNKSELAVGYSTLYGDSVGAISLLGDLYKSEVYQLANYLNRQYGQIIPQEIITRPPSAELRPNQEDAQSLPPYERLDPLLEGILSYRMGRADFIALGFAPAEVDQVLRLYKNSEYKRQQFCPILKIKAKSFGFGHRNPISKSGQFYTVEASHDSRTPKS